MFDDNKEILHVVKMKDRLTKYLFVVTIIEYNIQCVVEYPGGGQYLEGPNVERPIFRNFEISNVKITKDELFDFLIFEFIFLFVLIIRTLKIYDNLRNWEFLEF